MLIPTENRRIQEIFKAFVQFSSTYQGLFYFQERPLNSSTFQACNNPVISDLISAHAEYFMGI